ncbi:hypothetical protein HY29_14685 [Hyphomonas beringensis]|uniref:Uncharacterized protein n=1 Tax=Hyphomonas beringensis TaxID=1280946 RepID=A0A062UCG8_9PROT|nr:hypothetical protein [Hyphomonas beringensis]KCZ54279.1 hypothetical protein HY29_14685 [Hyphomonas beringensis]
MRVQASLIALSVLVACGDAGIASRWGDGVQVFDRARYDTFHGFELETKALSGKWIVDCSATVSANANLNRNECVLKNWGGQKMATLGPIPAKRGLRIVISSRQAQSEITTIASSDYLEAPYLLSCGNLSFPPDAEEPLQPVKGTQVKAITDFLKTEKCTLGFRTREGEHAYDVNIPTEGFASASKFAEKWIAADHSR